MEQDRYLEFSKSIIAGVEVKRCLRAPHAYKSHVHQELSPGYILEGSTDLTLNGKTIFYESTILLGVLHTGVAYTLFFSLYAHMKSVEIVSYSYLEPLFGILFSVIFAGEALTFVQIIGGVLILGSTYIGEMLKDRRFLKAKEPAGM